MSSFWLGVALLIVAGLKTIDFFATIALVGKERKPVAPSTAVAICVWMSAYIVVMVLAGLRLVGR